MTSPSIGPPVALRLHAKDTVAVALRDIEVDQQVVPGVLARDTIPRGHKVALRPIGRGEHVTKFGQTIGMARVAIAAGEHVHTHNLAFEAVAPRRAIHSLLRNSAPSEPELPATFDGYVRPDGRVGTRNVLLVLATVNCSATVTRRIASEFKRRLDLAGHPGIDDVVALTHQHGCSFRADGPGMEILRRTLAGYAGHPNVGATLVVGLGCEDNQVDEFLARAGLAETEKIKPLVIQRSGGTTATIEAGIEALAQLLPVAASVRREQVRARHLSVGLQCGGSDGFSGLSANPALGHAADLVVAQGGTVILSETPEIYGAEQLLLDRVERPEVGERLIDLLRWWETQAQADAGTLDNNPSVGNKAGGITTILEKSLGAVAKGGTTPLQGVVAYAEPICQSGLVFMDSPGYDPVSATGQVASGANLVCFTTGRGSCFGCAPTPSLKLASTSDLYRRMESDMDIDCGTIIEGRESHAEVGQRIFERILAVASGEPTKSEALGYGEEEFIPWSMGLTY